MPERHIKVQRRMSASTASVWALFADFPNLSSHWSGVRATRAIGDQTSGVGARRRVELKPIGSMDETGSSPLSVGHRSSPPPMSSILRR